MGVKLLTMLDIGGKLKGSCGWVLLGLYIPARNRKETKKF
jgi:hypothetical protein